MAHRGGQKSIPGYPNPKCYARALKNCSTEINREHIVSETFLRCIAGEGGTAIAGMNLSHQKDPNLPETFGIGSLTAKVLCSFHNEALSIYDGVSTDMCHATEAIHDERRGLQATGKAWTIDGDLLECWILKVGIGGLYSGNWRTTPADGAWKKRCPPVEWLDLLYRGAQFDDRTGLYWSDVDVADARKWNNVSFNAAPILSMDNAMIGAFRVIFYGINLYLLMLPTAPGDPVFDTASYRPESLSVEGCQTRIEFAWKGGPKSGAVVVKR